MVKETRENGQRIGSGKPGPGRPKGRPNNLTISAREAFQCAFDELGGKDGLVSWAKSSEEARDSFYKLYARLIPVEVTGKDGKDLIPATPTEVARDTLFFLELAKREKRHSTTQH